MNLKLTCILTLLLFVSTTLLFAQPRTRFFEGEFTKLFLSDNGALTKANETTKFDTFRSVYFDDTKMLRRYYDWQGLAGGDGRLIAANYDSKGNLESIRFYFVSMDKRKKGQNRNVEMVWGYAYRVASGKVFYNYKQLDKGKNHNGGNGVARSATVANFPESLGTFNLAKYETAKSLREHWGIGKPTFPARSLRVRFREPVASDKTFVCAMDVIRRDEPSKQGGNKYMNYAHVGDTYLIKEVLPKKAGEKYSWYKVQNIPFQAAVHYLYGEHLEPVDEVVGFN